MKAFIATLTIILTAFVLTGCSTQYHVSTAGLDVNPGTKAKPFKTISAAAAVAQPGDTITVHEGIYREEINPPRGGTSDKIRITYQAAPGQNVEIRGSEVVTGWTKESDHLWKIKIENSLFGNFNPFADIVRGDWFKDKGRNHHTGCVYLDGHWLTEAASKEDLRNTKWKKAWLAEVKDKTTTVWATFDDDNPNESVTEVNVRQTVFYPKHPGINYITVRGFTMQHAATNWAPPTAEQIGLIGTHWSKGWIIENNVIRYSNCVGVTLGKYGDEFDNKAATADGYNATIERALKNGWKKETVGSHIVRNNDISHCEQAAIVGSLGAVFSTITGNHIHDIYVNKLFAGYEIAGIKFHAAIDCNISDNHIYRCGGSGGIWLDWMLQGTRVSGNLMHNNSQDLFLEVNHGPFLIDNNVCLSPVFLRDWSQGGAYVHNLATGKIFINTPQSRETPFHKAHSTEIVMLQNISGGDNRFINNVFLQDTNLDSYDKFADSMMIDGNLFSDSKVNLLDEPEDIYLQLSGPILDTAKHKLVTSKLLGRTKVSKQPFDQPDGKAYRIDTDYFGNIRDLTNPSAGPFENPGSGQLKIKIWPKK